MNIKNKDGKKGFTLIELLVFVVLLVMVTLVMVPVIQTNISSNREASFDSTESLVENAADLYASVNIDEVDFATGQIFIDLEDLTGYINEVTGPDGDKCTGGVVVLKDGESSYTYDAALTCGDMESSIEYDIAPIIDLNPVELGSQQSHTVDISIIDDNDEIVTTEYQWSTTGYEPESGWLDLNESSITKTGGDGKYYLFVKASDAIGNEIVADLPLYFDNTEPTIELSVENANNIVIEMQDLGSGIDRVEKDVDSSTIDDSGDDTVIYTVNANGEYGFTAIDKAGNSASSTVSVTSVDDVLPTMSLAASTTAVTNQDVTLTATASDSGTGMQKIELPDGTFVLGASATYDASTNGTYSFVAYDLANNTYTTSITVSNIDKVAPTVTISSGWHDGGQVYHSYPDVLTPTSGSKTFYYGLSSNQIPDSQSITVANLVSLDSSSSTNGLPGCSKSGDTITCSPSGRSATGEQTKTGSWTSPCGFGYAYQSMKCEDPQGGLAYIWIVDGTCGTGSGTSSIEYSDYVSDGFSGVISQSSYWECDRAPDYIAGEYCDPGFHGASACIFKEYQATYSGTVSRPLYSCSVTANYTYNVLTDGGGYYTDGADYYLVTLNYDSADCTPAYSFDNVNYYAYPYYGIKIYSASTVYGKCTDEAGNSGYYTVTVPNP